MQRWAVPFFFITSGFLFEDHCCNSAHPSLLAKESIHKYFRLYTFWTVIYLPLTIYSYVTNKYSFGKCLWYFIRGYCLVGEHTYSWILWYLLALIYCYIILYVVLKKNFSLKKLLILSLAALVFGGYIDSFVKRDLSSFQFLETIQYLIKSTVSSGRILKGIGYFPWGILAYRFFQKKNGQPSFLVNIALILVGLTGNCIGYIFGDGLLINLSVLIAVFALFIIVANMNVTCDRLCAISRRQSMDCYFVHLYIYVLMCLLIRGEMVQGFSVFIITVMLTVSGSFLFDPGLHRLIKN